LTTDTLHVVDILDLVVGRVKHIGHKCVGLKLFKAIGWLGEDGAAKGAAQGVV